MEATVMSRLSDVTFVIPLRIDSPERARNLDLLVEFLVRNFDSAILVMEADDQQRYVVKNDNHRIRYFFEEDNNPVFHRTRWLNRLYRKADTPVIAGWDTDILAPPGQIVETAIQVRNGQAAMGFPYNGHMYQTGAGLTLLYQETQNLDVFIRKTGELKPMYGDLSVGGAFIVDREKYLRAGGENEFFAGWGPEDVERVKRMEILYDQPVYRVMGGVFHLWHPRYINSRYADQQYEINGKKELLKICGMTADELQNYIQSWPWLENCINPGRINEPLNIVI